MKDNFENVEIFDEDAIITLYDDEDKPIDFFEVAVVELNGKFYEILQPVEEVEGIEEDEAVIFEYVKGENEDDRNYKPVFDEETLSTVFDCFLRASADKGHGCGCGCDDCADDCDCGEHDCDCGKEDAGCNCGKK